MKNFVLRLNLCQLYNALLFYNTSPLLTRFDSSGMVKSESAGFGEGMVEARYGACCEKEAHHAAAATKGWQRTALVCAMTAVVCVGVVAALQQQVLASSLAPVLATKLWRSPCCWHHFVRHMGVFYARPSAPVPCPAFRNLRDLTPLLFL